MPISLIKMRNFMLRHKFKLVAIDLVLLGIFAYVFGLLDAKCGKVYYDTQEISGVSRYECQVKVVVSGFTAE